MISRRSRPASPPERNTTDETTHTAGEPAPRGSDALWDTSYPDARLYREALADVAELAIRAPVLGVTLTVLDQDGRPAKAISSLSMAVSPEYFDFFGARFTLGRDFLPAEHRSDGPPVAVIDHSVWKRHMGADPEAIGRRLRLNGRIFTVVGVTPPDFDVDGFLPPAVHVPMTRYDDLTGKEVLADRQAWRFKNFIRLAPGAGPEEAEARLTVVARSLDLENPWPDEDLRQITVSRMDAVDFDLENSDLMMAGAVGLLLLLACANVANLLLARAAGRRREIAVLAALGASQARIAQRLLTESGLLALAGGALGLLVSRGLVDVIRLYAEDMAFGAGHYKDGLEWTYLDDRVFGFTLLMALVTGCLFGLAPIFHVARTDLVSALKGGSGEAKPGRRLGARHLLVIAQVALATTLLLVAGLLMRSLDGIENRELGFETARHVMAALVATPSEESLAGDSAQHREAWRNFYEAGRQRLEGLPGVEMATLTSTIPGTGKRRSGEVAFPDRPDETSRVDLHQVDPNFFETFNIPLVRGRFFDHRDRADAPGAAIVNQAFVDRFFADDDPIGQQLRWPNLQTDAAEGHFRVVGVIPDIRHKGRLAERSALVYLPLSQYLPHRFRNRMEVVARTSGPPRAVMPSALQALSTVHPDLAVLEIGLFDDVVNDVSIAKLHSVLSGLFSLFGLALACLGIYGVMSCSVSYRLRELGVRAALGASARDLVRLVLGEASRLTVAGIFLGVALTLALAKLISSLLHGVSAADPLTFLTLPVVLAAVGLAAAWLPAWRAGRVDPKVVLQEE